MFENMFSNTSSKGWRWTKYYNGTFFVQIALNKKNIEYFKNSKFLCFLREDELPRTKNTCCSDDWKRRKKKGHRKQNRTPLLGRDKTKNIVEMSKLYATKRYRADYK